MSLFTGLDEIVTENEPLANYTWFKIGGPAQYLVRPRNDQELQTALARCRDSNLPWRVLGHGANLLVDDAGICGAVIQLDPTHFGHMDFDDATAALGGAATLAKFVLESVRRGLGGTEVLAGIPGSLGGAVKMNAGGRYGDIATLVSRVKVIDESGHAFWRERPELIFDYRWTNIHHQIVTAVELNLVPDDPTRILNKMREVWIIKKASQPLSSRSAGCVFKNPSPHQPAGALIDKAGLKGTRIGNTFVSDQHANFIIAEPGATYADVISLINRIKQTVADSFGIQLQPEVEIWTDQPTG